MRELNEVGDRLGGSCETGQAVVTGAGRLPAKYVLHAVGPRYRDGKHGEPELLKQEGEWGLFRLMEEGTVQIDKVDLSKHKLPKLALANGLFQGRVPPELRDLTWAEQRLIARVRVSAHIIHLSSDKLVNESELELREAEFEADVQLREDRMERWRTDLEELEQTLERRERDLVSYVDQLQGAMSGPSNDAWWQRPAGGDGGVY